MIQIELPVTIYNRYLELQDNIRQRLNDYSRVSIDKYFYEFCFCLCTPQSQAINALAIQSELERTDYYNNPYNVTSLLRDPKHYIRFHNVKAKRIQDAAGYFSDLMPIITSIATPCEKRNFIAKNVNGIGMKEASHFLRNIGFRGLAILDRHILKHIVLCGIYDDIPKISNINKYLEVESKFLEFADRINIPVDELDLLFWSYETGKILK